MRAGCTGGEIGETAQCGKPPRRRCELSGGMRGRLVNTPIAPHGDRSKQGRKDKWHAPRAPRVDIHRAGFQRVEIL